MKIQINHTTRYTYTEPVTDSVNEIRLTPRTNYRQSCFHHEVEIFPPANLLTYEDFFGNRVHAYSVNKPHTEMVIHTRATVVTVDKAQGADLPRLPLEEQIELMKEEDFQNRYTEYILPTRYTEVTPELMEFASQHPFDEAEDLYEWTRKLSTTIYEQFTYDPGATSVNTTVKKALKLKRGVCQDYAHLMIAVCRSVGLPSRYVSGYHYVSDLQGGNADFEQASHAWVETHIPGTGWLGFDPTNDVEVNWRYVKLGHGRDYKDIVPVKGVYRGIQGQLEVTVDVQLLDK
ncbi:Transglutaminase-like enzyme, putative cysteine protease [Paenibacillus sophorae]|uniref:Transglutaminase family protein n=1 Tax=Paenibacillus sophorae TaxID=1333845 RepID=A0A1H8K8G5_9BACL|nr:transglutaminase family protein [Paenibacillus sophorae]QWU13647.1 transglutaminase family protein [Paenibacillus sophorae]SEN89155.1 Transglutaminase-like enzyme, putative cysteine protease [Paenibacillus sophorae]